MGVNRHSKFALAARLTAMGVALAGVAYLAIAAAPAQSQSTLLQDGRLGFVVTDFGYVLAEQTPQAQACPNGRTPRYRDIYAATPEGARRAGESDAAYEGRIRSESLRYLTRENGESICQNPEGSAPMPHWPVSGNVAIDGGIDLDGQVSRANGRAAPGTCAHDDFTSRAGVRGVDNQFYRMVGCSNGYGPNGSATEFDIEMYTGAWGILIALSGVDDLRNDNDVEVGIYANGDPIQLSPNREALANVTYAASQNPAYRATTHGRIVNGVLTTDPVARFAVPKITNAVYLVRSITDARIRATIGADGSLEGVFAGYTPIDEMYDFQFGFRSGVDANGQPARQRVISANGSNLSAGLTCQGVYAALHQLADGHRDPATGRCTAISTQYRIRAIPAFVVDQATQSVNADLRLTNNSYSPAQAPPPRP